MTDLSHSDVAGSLRQAVDSLSALWTSGGAKGLLRRFAECLTRDFGVSSMAFATRARDLQHGGGMTSTSLGIPGIATIDDTLLRQIAEALSRRVLRDEELWEGVFFLSMENRSFAVVAVDLTDTESGFFLWEMTAACAGAGLPLLELLVKGFQNEARWYKKFDSTKALIYCDDLTGLYNTRYIEIAIGHELKRAQRYKLPFSLLFIDLDGFKPINDQHGHLSGSAVLKQVAHVIRDVVREIDIPIRYGGDEFVVLLVGATSQTGLLVAERVRRRIAQEEFKLVEKGVVRLTCSIGVASFPDHGHDLGSLLKVADDNMYQSKKSGKNRVSIVNRRIEENAR